MANISLTEVDVAIPEFWAANALGALKANTVMAQLVRRDFDNEVATNGDTVNVTRRGALTVNDKGTNSTVSLQNPSNTKIPVVLNQHKEVSWLIEDIASAKAIETALDYVEDAAIVIAELVDSSLTGLYTEAASVVGDPTDEMAVATIVAARKALNDLKAPQSGRVMVVGTGPEAALLNIVEFVSADFGGEDQSRAAVIEASLGRKYGFDFFVDQQVTQTAGTPNIDHNIAFHRDAFVLVSRTLPLPPSGTGVAASTVSEDGVGMRALRAYNASHLGMQMTIDILFGVKALRADTHAVEVVSTDEQA